MSTKPAITLYSVPCKLPEKHCSPYAWMMVALLRYKEIPYKVEWIHFEDIERVCKEVGAPPTLSYGVEKYTIPFITVKSSTGEVTAISDSLRIAAYIETTFPDPERVLIPPGTLALHAAFGRFLSDDTVAKFRPLIMMPFVSNLVSPEWFIKAREKDIGKPLAEIAPKPNEIEGILTTVEAGLDSLAIILDANNLANGTTEVKKINVHVMGEQFSYADIILLGGFQMLRLFCPEHWARLKLRNGGRWGSLMDAFDPYLKPFDA